MKNVDKLLRDLLTPDWALFERMARERPRPMRKGSKHKPEARAKMSAGVQAFHSKRREILAKAHQRINPPKWQTLLKRADLKGIGGLAGIDRMFASMDPGAWYASVDLSRGANLDYGSCKAWVVKYCQRGLLRRVENPEWREQRAGQRSEPRWLYMLTPAGENRRALALALR
jgi:hypothetical protein